MEVKEKVRDTLIKASSRFRDDQKKAYIRAINKERNPQAKWVMQNILENAMVAERKKRPMCDDTGIPHLLLEIGPEQSVDYEMLEDIKAGISEGLKLLPGRPMAVKGDYRQVIEQKIGLYDESEAVEAAPIILKPIDEDIIRLHIIMTGGGPEIRGRTNKVFHKHDIEHVISSIVEYAKEEVVNLGCTPCALAVGIGRSHFEATSMMVQAMAYGDFGIQNDLEKEITERINQCNAGPLNLGGDTTVLATFLRIGPQRASGVRIVCIRPCCCFEPRTASVIL